jgi:hypothetical protein
MVEMLLHGILSNQIVIAKVAPSPLQRIDEKEKRKKRKEFNTLKRWWRGLSCNFTFQFNFVGLKTIYS